MPQYLPLVSVIIPCYKQANFLPEAIDSILNQHYSNYEIIVINDGSPDNVEEVVKHYRQVKYIEQENKGVSIARNKGILESKGSFLIFLDADDRLLPNALEVGAQYLIKNKDYSFVSGGVKLIDQKGVFIKVPKQPNIEKDYYKSLLEANFIWTPGVVMYRRSVFETSKGFFSWASPSEDYELNVRIARKSLIYHHGEIILEYRVHNSNTSKNYLKMLRSGITVRRQQYKYIKHDPVLLKSWKAGIGLIQKDVGNKLIKQIIESLIKKRLNKDVSVAIFYLIKFYPRGFLKFLKAYIKSIMKNEPVHSML
jgi:glycosyltransferase involved in cell wall biosynthesis